MQQEPEQLGDEGGRRFTAARSEQEYDEEGTARRAQPGQNAVVHVQPPETSDGARH